MVRMLQALSVLALVCAGIVFALCAAQWLRGTPQIEADSNLSVVEKFRQAGGDGERNTHETLSPLVAQAEAFALYLNPPKPVQVKEAPAPKSSSKQSAPAVELPQTTPKFSLLATSYYRARPEESLALVSEPGRDPRWVTQGTRLGHFVVEEIGQRVIVCRDGQERCQMAMDTKAPVDTEQAGGKALAAGNPAPPGVTDSPPEPSAGEKPKTRPRQPMHKLGPARQEIHVVAYDHETTSG